jgi:hypothetical protein
MTHSLTREQKIEKSEELVRKSYYKNSVVDQLVNVRDAHPDEFDFLKLGRRIYIPEEWYSREDIYYDVALQQLGRNIAFSEKKFIIEEILKNERIKHISIPETNLTVLKEQIQRIVDETNTYPEILLAPVDYFVKFHDWYRSMTDRSFRMETFDKMIISGHSYRVLWSNKYIPFKEFIFANKSYGEWVAKPSINKRFYVKISESDKPDKLDLLMYTTLKFSILEPNRITILQQSDTDNQSTDR